MSTNKITITVSGASGTGKSAIMGLIAEALSKADMVEKVVVVDDDFPLYGLDQYIDRANRVSTLAAKKVDVEIYQEQKPIEGK